MLHVHAPFRKGIAEIVQEDFASGNALFFLCITPVEQISNSEIRKNEEIEFCSSRLTWFCDKIVVWSYVKFEYKLN